MDQKVVYWSNELNMNPAIVDKNYFTPLSDIAPKFDKWLQSADRAAMTDANYDVLQYYGRILTASEATFCGGFARYLIFGLEAPNLEENCLYASPMYRQALLEKIVRKQLQLDGYMYP